MREIRPQEGPQEKFLSTPADIAIYGGAAGAGKSFALLMECLRHLTNPKFGAVIFRRESPQITAEGGLWDTSFELYPHYKGKPIGSPKLHWRFPSGSKISFSHLQHEKNIYSWQGSQIPFIGFDELTHFTERMFFYLISRNRSMCGVRPYIRGTCNPDPDSWLCNFLLDAGFIDPETGYPVYEMSGKIKYFIRESGVVYWSDSEKELKDKYPESTPKTFTFIPATIKDNKKLLDVDPGYLSNLNAMLQYEKKRLKDGNWFARPSAGELFKRHYFKLIDKEDLPVDFDDTIRYWDRAATLPNDKNPDPDYTAGLKMFTDIHEDKYYIIDIVRDRLEPADVEATILQTAEIDNDEREVLGGLEQDPAQAGKYEIASYKEKFAEKNLPFQEFPKTKAKLACWKPVARAAKNGKIYLVKASWNEAFLRELEGVTDGTQEGHDDQADALAGAYNYLFESDKGSFSVLPNIM